MVRRIESLFLTGDSGRLEALLEEPEEGEPVEGALVCHPHPKFGGTMHNKVVYRLARGLRKTGCVVLRFNFRGVNLSEGEYGHGVGETEDARTALRELATRYPNLSVVVAGFSFGSRVALRLASSETAIQRVIAAGFPTRIPERDFVYQLTIPKHFIQSMNDEYSPAQEMAQFYGTLPEPKSLTWIDAADHFFKDRLEEFEAKVEQLGRERVFKAV